MAQNIIIEIAADVPGSPLSAVRDWLAEGLQGMQMPHDIGAQYTGDRPGSISLVAGTDSHKEDITGADIAKYNYTLLMQCNYGPDPAQNMMAASACGQIATWVREQNHSGNFPKIPGYMVDGCTAVNPMMISVANSTALYQVQIAVSAEQE